MRRTARTLVAALAGLGLAACGSGGADAGSRRPERGGGLRLGGDR